MSLLIGKESGVSARLLCKLLCWGLSQWTEKPRIPRFWKYPCSSLRTTNASVPAHRGKANWPQVYLYRLQSQKHSLWPKKQPLYSLSAGIQNEFPQSLSIPSPPPSLLLSLPQFSLRPFIHTKIDVLSTYCIWLYFNWDQHQRDETPVGVPGLDQGRI